MYTVHCTLYTTLYTAHYTVGTLHAAYCKFIYTGRTFTSLETMASDPLAAADKCALEILESRE